jgi:hypothetical protein
MDHDRDSKNDFVEKRYQSAIDYYWKASRHNKRAYKWIRGFTLILGSLVTLVASLSSFKIIQDDPLWAALFAISAPLLAAVMTVLSGFSQSFQWGAAWHDMVITAESLEKERDRFFVTKPEEKDLVEEVALLNDFIISESQGFFQRILGSFKSGKNQ